MASENWNTTPQEHVLDTLYEAVVGYTDEFTPDLWGVQAHRPLAELYLEDADGNCWQITATPHPHNT